MPPLTDKAAETEAEQAKAAKKTAIISWLVIAIGMIAIIWMIAVNPRQKALHCDLNAQPSLTAFGSCTTE